MRPTRSWARRRTAGRLAGVLLLVGLLGGGVAGAWGKVAKLPINPTCSKFSPQKVSKVLAVGRRMYLDHTLVHGTSCFYQGLSPKQAAALEKTQVPYNKITYYPSLEIDVQKTKKEFFNLQEKLLHRSGFEVGQTARKDVWRIGSEELFSTGEVTGSNMQPCDPMILYNNWVGPPECRQQPALHEVSVLAWIPLGGSLGRMVFLSASAQSGRPLNLSHVLELAKESVTGALY
jgi:hypothetical protein